MLDNPHGRRDRDGSSTVARPADTTVTVEEDSPQCHKSPSVAGVTVGWQAFANQATHADAEECRRGFADPLRYCHGGRVRELERAGV